MIQNNQMKIYILSLFALLFSLSSFGKVVLLTSLDPDENRPPLRFKSWNINEKLEKRFYKSLKQFPQTLEDKDIVIKHMATPTDLYLNLIDPTVSALIWVGHAGFADNGLTQSRSIVDFKNRDLQNIFQAAHPGLKFLGLVGCRGELFLDEWKKQGWFKDHPYLKTFGRKVRTGARKGLRLAMKDLKKRIEDNSSFIRPIEIESNQSSLSVLIERHNFKDQTLDSVQILQKNQLIGFLPASNENQYLVVKLKPGKSAFDYKIVLDTGFASPAPSNPNLGRLQITSQTDILTGFWELFQTKDGNPIGVGKNIYQYKGNTL